MTMHVVHARPAVWLGYDHARGGAVVRLILLLPLCFRFIQNEPLDKRSNVIRTKKLDSMHYFF